jgi:hypothetical protein
VLGKVVVHMLAGGEKPARLDGEVGDDAGATGLLGGLDDLSKLLRMARTGGAKVQLCGRLVVKLGAQRVEKRHDTMCAGDCS